jgi:hypothetical protein
MGAELVDQAEPTVAISERQEAFGQNLDPHRRGIISRQFLGKQDGQPVAAKKLPAGRARAGLG